MYALATHNPTELNKQGPDRGPQYRTAIFPWDDEQKAIASAYDGEKLTIGQLGGYESLLWRGGELLQFYEQAESSSAPAGGQLEQCSQCRRYRDIRPDNRFDDVVELGWMRGGNGNPRLALAPRRRKLIVDMKRGRGVWAPYSAATSIVGGDLTSNGLVIDRAGFYRPPELGEIRNQMAQTFHIAGVAHIHGRCERLNAAARLPVAGR